MLRIAKNDGYKRKTLMPNQSPDILLIILDTLRRDRVSAYGGIPTITPALDAFAEGATLFDRAVSPAQWTVPSHASMFTGVYPSTHQVTQANHRLSGSYPTLAEILQVGGYKTIGFCNNPLVGVLDTGLTRGFDEFYNYAGAAVNRPQDVSKSQIRQTVSRTWGKFATRVSNTFAHSDFLFRTSLHPLLTPIWTRSIHYKGHTQNSVDDLIGYMQAQHADNERKPLFTFLNLMGAHTPYRPPQDVIKQVARDIWDDKQAYAFMRQFNADAARWASPVSDPLSAFEQTVLDGFYTAEVAHQDAQLGRLLRYLEDSGTLDNTMVIIIADHGEGHGDHLFFGHSFVVYQELVHVPLIIRAPHMPAKRVTTPVSTRRIFHTALDYANIAPPLSDDDPNGDTHALSLARATNGLPDTEGGMAFAEAFPPNTLLNMIKHRNPAHVEHFRLQLIRRGAYHADHKLATVGDSVEGVFNIAQDPAERHNVADENPIITQQLQANLKQFVRQSEQQRADVPQFGREDEAVLENLRALGYIE